MKVKELIEKLKKYDPNLDVVTHFNEDYSHYITSLKLASWDKNYGYCYTEQTANEFNWEFTPTVLLLD